MANPSSTARKAIVTYRCRNYIAPEGQVHSLHAAGPITPFRNVACPPGHAPDNLLRFLRRPVLTLWQKSVGRVGTLSHAERIRLFGNYFPGRRDSNSALRFPITEPCGLGIGQPCGQTHPHVAFVFIPHKFSCVNPFFGIFSSKYPYGYTTTTISFS